MQASLRASLTAKVAGGIDNPGVGLVAQLLPHQQLCVLAHCQAEVAIEGAIAQIGRDVGCGIYSCSMPDRRGAAEELRVGS